MTPNPPVQGYNWTFWRVVWATLVLVALGLGFWILYRFNQVIFILFIAIVIGTIIRPVVAWLHRRGLPQRAGIILVYLLLLALLTGFGLLLFPLIAEQSVTITAAVPGYYQSLLEWMVDHPSPLMESLTAVLPPTLSLPEPIQQTGQEILDSAGQALGYVGATARVIFTAVAILLLAFYWTLDGPRTIHALLLLLPRGQRESSRELVAAMETKVGAYIAGQGILILVIGSISLLAYWLIGLPYILLLGFGGCDGGGTAHWAAAGSHSGRVGGPLPRPGQAYLGYHCYPRYSAARKQRPGTACHASGGGGQSLRFPAGNFCLWLLAGYRWYADGYSPGSHYPALAGSLHLSS